MMKKLQFFYHEARLLRAYFFFELAKRYGDIAMPLSVLTTTEANAIEKTSFQDVISFIAAECDETSKHLPVSHEPITGQIGRVTKGFAMALKSRALLYAASKLHNKSNDLELWKAAAKAAGALIDSCEEKGWYRREYGTTAANNFESLEAITFRMNPNNEYFEQINFPVRFTAGHSTMAGTCPSQNLVEAFETINGYSVRLGETGWSSDDPDFDPLNPYQARDPRFAKTVMYDGAAFKNSTIETFVGGQDDAPIANGGTPTGYFLRKYVQETTSFDPGLYLSNKHFWVIFKYGEILLNSAEAMVEAFNDPNYTDGDFTKSASWALNEVRRSVPMPEVKIADKDAFIIRLRNERRVELAFEDHRFWDIRRWEIGTETQKELYGVRIVDAGNGERTYRKFLYETRFWNNRMNLYPIPQAELHKNANLNPQNAGW
jgi:hypothetical protein